jgi:hypothetical protein
MNMQQTKVVAPLSRKAILLSVRISQWTARKLDRQITDETNRKYNATSDAGRYNKLLIDADHLADITTIVSKVRQLHYTMTRPWMDEGARILPNALYAKFTDEFRVLKREFENAVDQFCAEYPRYIAERKIALNGAFKETDYPSAGEIRNKFILKYSPMPFPDAEDFRSDLDDDTVADIKAEIAAMSDQVLNDAMKGTAEQIIKLVGHMAEKLKEHMGKKEGERKFFMDSLVDNVRELADLLPAFNLTNDPKLTKITKRIKKELCVEDAVTLRKNPDAALSVQKSAEEIVAETSKFFA